MILRLKLFILALLSAATLVGCGSDAPKLRFTTPQPPGDTSKAAQANNAFTWALWAKLSASETENVFFSPASISQSLSLAATGAQGLTAQEIWSALGFADASDQAANQHALIWSLDQAQTQGVQLSCANALWATAADPLKPAFVTQAQSLFGANVQNLEFTKPTAAASTINDWIAANTSNKIKNLVPASALNKDIRVVVTNAVYFKADWDDPFEVKNTRPQQFKPIGKTPVTVNMMSGERHGIWADDDAFLMIQLPYKGGRMAFRAFLPQEGTSPVLDAQRLARLMKKKENTQFFVGLPKFIVEWEKELVTTLQSLGIKQAFTDGDFTPAFQNTTPSIQPIQISDVRHKTFIQIDEKGTEAAASSFFEAKFSAAPEYTFIADRPFIFQIIDLKTDTIVFMGRVSDPKE